MTTRNKIIAKYLLHICRTNQTSTVVELGGQY
uniref:Uncharacterized protein n=1 Tax=Arundo donax TaxID=35708 RepID=A0A0A9A4J7_ARUDO